MGTNNQSKRVFTNGEEAYVARDMAHLREYLKSEDVGYDDDDIGDDSEWSEQTGDIGILLDPDEAEKEKRTASRAELDKYPGQVLVVKPAHVWASEYPGDAGQLWTRNT